MCYCIHMSKRRHDSVTAEERFRQLAQDHGCTVTSPWVSRNHAISIIQPCGHGRFVFPSNSLRGQSMTFRCTGCANDAFLRDLCSAGITVTKVAWRGASAKYPATCSAGHRIEVQPNKVQQRGAKCSVCTGRTGGVAERKFRDCVRIGGGCVTGSYVNPRTPVAVTCTAEGHVTHPWPGPVQSGRTWACPTCKLPEADVFYVVANRGEDQIKFGVTRGQGADRLAAHARDGFTDVVRLWVDVPEGRPYDLEQSLIRRLSDAGITPVRGREYFRSDVERIVLAVADAFLTPTQPNPASP